MASVANLIPKLIIFVVYFTIQFCYYDKQNITKLDELLHIDKFNHNTRTQITSRNGNERQLKTQALA